MVHAGELSQQNKGNTLSDMILGGQDGLVNVLGVALTSKIAQRDHYRSELAREKREIHQMPDKEEEEIRKVYRDKGFNGKILEDIVSHIMSSDKLWVDQMMREELELKEVTQREIYLSSFIVGFAALVGSFVPLTAFFFAPIHLAIWISLGISVVVLLAVGFYKAKMTIGSPIKSAVQMAAIGMGAALAGYFIGKIFS